MITSGIGSVWPVPADTGTLFADDGQWLNLELAAVNGPWTLQGEYLWSFLHEASTSATGPVNPDVLLYKGWYVQLLYFLTGEHDMYNRKTGVFERVIPRENFFFVNTDCGRQYGRGAWQIGARYNYLDLNDDGFNGGILHNATCGLNWFWNPNMKMQFDYSLTHRDAALSNDLGDGWIHGCGIRVAADF